MTWYWFLGFVLAGLAGSVHCIGMCGPLLAGLHLSGSSNSSEPQALTINRRLSLRALLHAAASTSLYHVGRIWTYAVLGGFSIVVLHSLGELTALHPWQRWSGAVLAGALGLIGLSVLLFPRRFDVTLPKPIASIFQRVYATLIGERRWYHRFVLGALMGFLPCGLVYTVLLAAATSGNPMHASLAMVAFGIGTVPSLVGVLVLTRMTPPSWRIHSRRISGVAIVVAAGLLIWRSWPTSADQPCPMCETKQVSVPPTSSDEMLAQDR